MSGRLVAVGSSSICGIQRDVSYFIVMERPLTYDMNAGLERFASSVDVVMDPTEEDFLGKREAINKNESENIAFLEPDVDVKADNTEEVLRVAVITVDIVSGQLLYTGVPQKDLFAVVQDAMDAIPALCPHTASSLEVRVVCEFDAFAGGCLTEECIHLLFIEKSTQVLGNCITNLNSSTTRRVHNSLAASSLSSCIPTVFAVKKAQWYNIPLRIAVSALQQHFTSSDVCSWIPAPCDTNSSLLSFSLVSDVMPPYLYFSPAMDVTHCSVFTAAVRRGATLKTGGSRRNSCQQNAPLNMDNGSFTIPAYINEFLPSLSARTGRDALGRCDCLWNEELIAFCDLFGLGDWCCRLALGSCSVVPVLHPVSESHIALLVVRLSRLAFSGCFYDYSLKSARVQLDQYLSTLETEFQLVIMRAYSSNHGGKETSDSVSSLVWRRGADFSEHTELLEQKKRFEKYVESFIDPLPPCEDHIAGIFFSYLERYGSGTKICLTHAGVVEMQGPNLTSGTICNTNDTHKGTFLFSQTERSFSKKCLFSPFQTPPRSVNMKLQLTKTLCEDQNETEFVAVELADVSKSLQETLRSLAEHVKAHGLRPPVIIGALSSVSPSSSSFPSFSAGDNGLMQAPWERNVLNVTREKVPVNWVPRVCVRDETQASSIASTIVSIGWAVSWLYSQLHGDGDMVRFVLEQETWVDNIIRLMVSSTVGTPRIRAAFLTTDAVSRVRRCLIVIYKGPPTAFSSTVWATAQHIEQLAQHVEEADPVSVVASASAAVSGGGGGGGGGTCSVDDADHSALVDGVMLSFLMKLFLTGENFYPRELVRHRSVLLSHPSQMSSIINVQLMVPSELQRSLTTSANAEAEMFTGSQRSCLFPLTPMHHLNPPILPDDESSLLSYSVSGPTPTLCMFQGLAHPLSQPLRVPSCFNVVEFTVALPFLSYVTHVALLVASSVQEAPYAAALSLSLATCCYVGQAHERAVFEDVSLPLCVSNRTFRSRQASPRLVFFELDRPLHVKTHFSVVEETDAGIGKLGHRYNHKAPVIARFLRFSLRGSGCHPMAVPPLLVFGEPVDHIPPDELDLVVGRHTTLRRMIALTRSSFLGRLEDDIPVELIHNGSPNLVSAFNDQHDDVNGDHDSMGGGKTENVRQISMLKRPASEQECQIDTTETIQDRQVIYMHKVISLIPREIFRLNFALTVEMELKRRQCHVCCFYRDLCLHRIGIPRWVMNPAFQVLPHSTIHRSRLPEEAKSIVFLKEPHMRSHCDAKEKKKGMMEKYEGRKRCNFCFCRFSWFYSAKECDRCQRYVCKKCLSQNLVRLPELGLSEVSARVCSECFKKVTQVEDTLRGFLWSEHQCEGEGVTENDAAIDFYTRYTTPQLASVLMLYPSSYSRNIYAGLMLTRGLPYQLTMYPLTHVVSVPGMDDKNTLSFEDVLGFAGISKSTPTRWRCVSDKEWTNSSTRVCRHVVILLPHQATVSYGLLRYMLTGELRRSIDVQLHLGNSMQTIQLFQSGCIGKSDSSDGVLSASMDNLRELRLCQQKITLHWDTKKGETSRSSFSTSSLRTMSTNTATIRLAALFFVGSISDLSLLQVDHFSLWGRFSAEVLHLNSAYYKCKPDMSRYGSLRANAVYSTSGTLGIACLPRMLSMTRLIPLRNIIQHTATEMILTEFDFGVPVTVCGFTLELHHPVAMMVTHCGIATALRLIGVTASGYRGNMGVFRLPWPPLPSSSLLLPSSPSLSLSDGSPHDIFSYAYSLPLTGYDILSVLVEVVEWRLTADASTQIKKKMKRKNRSTRNDNIDRDMLLTESEYSSRRGIYLGKIQFWTSADAKTRHVVNSQTYISIHATLGDTRR